MATLGNYYIDTATLATATAVWTDATFTVKAPDGWYQSCGVVREQSGGFLLPPDSCAYPCRTDCGIPPQFDNAYFGVYDLPEIVVGTGLGAIKVEINSTGDLPTAVYATWAGGTQSAMSSQNFGYVQGPYIGSAAQFAAYGFPAGSPYLLPTFVWGGGAADNWLPDTTESITIPIGDTTSTAGAVGSCILYVPKIDINPSTFAVRVVSAVGGPLATWSVSNNCPVPLTLKSVTDPAPSSVAACGLPIVNTVYNGPVNGTAATIGLYDWMFTDANGEIPMATAPGFGTGYYHYVEGGVNKWFQLDANSIVSSLGNC